MNMFKNLFASALVIFGLALIFADPKSWSWPDVGGPMLVEVVMFCTDARPYSVIIFFAVALTLFMIKKQY